MSLITPNELDLYTNIPLTAQYPVVYLASVIEGVSTNVQSVCEDWFTPQDVVDKDCPYWRYGGNIVFFIRDKPLVHLSGADWLDDFEHGRTAIDLSSVRIDYTRRRVYIPLKNAIRTSYQFELDSRYRLLASYRAGYATPPGDVKRAVALLAQEQINAAQDATDGKPGQLQSFRNINYSESYFPSAKSSLSIGLGTQLTDMAERLLRPYLGSRLTVTGAST